MSYLIQQWFCKGCKSIKPRAAFPPHIDLHTRCIDCQRGVTPNTGDTATPGAAASVPARVRANRRHSRDNRQVD